MQHLLLSWRIDEPTRCHGSSAAAWARLLQGGSIHTTITCGVVQHALVACDLGSGCWAAGVQLWKRNLQLLVPFLIEPRVELLSMQRLGRSEQGAEVLKVRCAVAPAVIDQERGATCAVHSRHEGISAAVRAAWVHTAVSTTACLAPCPGSSDPGLESHSSDPVLHSSVSSPHLPGLSCYSLKGSSAQQQAPQWLCVS